MLTPAVSGLSRLQHLHWRAPLPQVDLAGLAGLTSLTFLHVDNKAVNTQPRLPTPDLPPALSALRHLQVCRPFSPAVLHRAGACAASPGTHW